MKMVVVMMMIMMMMMATMKTTMMMMLMIAIMSMMLTTRNGHFKYFHDTPFKNIIGIFSPKNNSHDIAQGLKDIVPYFSN